MVLLESVQKLKPGTKAPDFKLKATDNKIYSLANFEGSKALVIIFICNHCPYVKAKIAKIVQLALKYKNQGVQFVLINPNNNPNYPEDSFENMVKFAKENKIFFPYLFDETQEVAKSYGAVCTPDPFVFDSSFKLVYHGRIDDAHYPSAQNPTSEDLEEAILATIEGKKLNKKFLPSRGCSIKWRE
ncbi:MAG: thioredoxin family protein [Candidatus Micrarchaeota archaeon]|nr:thioredoxin family protein [Candidatus Micrarchaeota archaeon]